jgi:hypothetical protein
LRIQSHMQKLFLIVLRKTDEVLNVGVMESDFQHIKHTIR